MIAFTNSLLRPLRKLSLGAVILAAALSPGLQAQTPQGLSQSAGPLPGSLEPQSSPLGPSSTNIGPVSGAGIGLQAGSGNAEGDNTSIDNGESQSLNSSISLSTDQIISVLQEQPDALVELKSLVADLATQQGTPVQPDSIS